MAISKFLDDVSRVLASPVPRRQALKYIGGGLVSVAVAAIGIKGALAEDCPTTRKCGPKCCAPTEQCIISAPRKTGPKSYTCKAPPVSEH